MNLKIQAIHWYYNEFKNTKLFKDMENTIEDSPWHRESSVAVHTDMVVAYYLSNSQPEWTVKDLIGFLTVVFHDVGKPLAKVEKYKEDRGKYFAFYGHELISARLFENFIYSSDLIFNLEKIDIFHISWLIEYHVPWAITKSSKINNLVATVSEIFGFRNQIFFDILYADTYGRISDDWQEKVDNSITWCNNFQKLLDKYLKNNTSKDHNEKVVYMAIGPSGSGKSTLYKTLVNIVSDLVHYSWDQYRLDWYTTKNEQENNIQTAYSKAFSLACEDKEFLNKVNKEFFNIIKSGKSIFVDNTNLSQKRRKMYIDYARKNDYAIHGIVLPNTIAELNNRQDNRKDKIINEIIIKEQYMRMQNPSYGEFDIIKII